MNEREEQLEKVIQKLVKRFGEEIIMRLGDEPYPRVDVISTGSLSLDLALGVGGFPRGRVVEIYGPDASGKTTLCLHTIAEAQRTGGVAAFIDMEHCLDLDYATNIGVDVSNLLISQPNTGERALEVAEELVRSNAVDVIVIDSVSALVPKKEIEGEMGDQVVGLQARLMSQALRKLSGAIKQSNCLVIFINQIRHKIGVIFGSPETTSGGLALKFYASVRLDIRRRKPIKKGDEIIGNRTRVRVVKNKVAPPLKTAEFDLIYGEGICRAGETLDIGEKLGVITRKGSYYYWNTPDLEEEKLGQGRDNAINFLQTSPPTLMDSIRGQIETILHKRPF